jgi:hypothetical protein
MIKSKNDKNTFAFVQFSSAEEARVSCVTALLPNLSTLFQPSHPRLPAVCPPSTAFVSVCERK